MIIVFFGQPHSGKTTLAKELLDDNNVHIDGDNLRDLFKNKDYSREGRIKNLNRASDIAVFINSLGKDVIISLMYPYQEARDYLNFLCKDVIWIYLKYEGTRGRELYHVEDFEVPYVFTIDTSKLSIPESIKIIKKEIYSKFLDI
jgi:adenylylsulfate kinase-like enzyme